RCGCVTRSRRKQLKENVALLLFVIALVSLPFGSWLADEFSPNDVTPISLLPLEQFGTANREVYWPATEENPAGQLIRDHRRIVSFLLSILALLLCIMEASRLKRREWTVILLLAIVIPHCACSPPSTPPKHPLPHYALPTVSSTAKSQRDESPVCSRQVQNTVDSKTQEKAKKRPAEECNSNNDANPPKEKYLRYADALIEQDRLEEDLKMREEQLQEERERKHELKKEVKSLKKGVETLESALRKVCSAADAQKKKGEEARKRDEEKRAEEHGNERDASGESATVDNAQGQATTFPSRTTSPQSTVNAHQHQQPPSLLHTAQTTTLMTNSQLAQRLLDMHDGRWDEGASTSSAASTTSRAQNVASTLTAYFRAPRFLLIAVQLIHGMNIDGVQIVCRRPE
ncbi:hypothetical protein PRIPAC_87695, partial [Pristionchus pacificus]|uniref:Uncharacterized protein n=1 Tax=Pristionchus pacificus TaxID=54126 RepID=A0A2A6B6R6_PRIPA